MGVRFCVFVCVSVGELNLSVTVINCLIVSKGLPALMKVDAQIFRIVNEIDHCLFSKMMNEISQRDSECTFVYHVVVCLENSNDTLLTHKENKF